MAVNFNIQFRISVATKVIRLTDTSTGFTYGNGCFKVEFPDGSVRNLPDFTNPDLNSTTVVTIGYIDIPCVTDINNNVIKGTHTISYAATNNTATVQTPLVRTFDFNWIEPTNGITNLSDVLIPEVVFSDVTSYSPIGSFTGVLTRTISSSFPSTSEASAQSAITSTTTNLIRVVSGTNYYEGNYTPTSAVSITYTHSSNSWLTIFYSRTFSKTFAIKKCPNQLELVTKINNYRTIIDAYKSTNDTQFNILSNQYDIVISLYSHLIARYQTSTQDGSEPILRELLSILEPYTGTYTYQSTKMLPFELTSSGTNSFNISDGINVDAVALGSTVTFSSTNASLASIVTDNNVTYSPTFGTLINTFAQGNDSRFHNPVTIGTANGLSISTQALSLAAATTGSAGSMSSADKTKLDGIAAGATANTGTVTSVALTVPTAFSVTGSPITTAGTLAIAAAGTSAQYITGAGALTTLNTLNVPENTNLYFTTSRARTSISLTTTGTTGAATYDNATGILNIPSYIGGVTSFNTRTGAIVLSSSDVTTALTYTPVPNNRILTINGVSLDLSADRSWTIASGVTSFNTRTGAITPTAGDYTTALVTESGNLYYTDARARAAISLTTTGTSGSATYNNTTGVLNIPAYQGGVTSFNTRTGAITLTSGDVTTALTYTPYNATNPSGYISGITSGNVTTALGFTPENAANKGIANGYASLDGGGLVPSTQLPSYVDDVLEFANLASLPATGETGKIYVALDTNKIYRWSGTTYIEVSPTVGTIWGGITGTLSNQTDLQNALNLKAPLASPTFTGTVSGITKTMVGLSNVDNTTDLNKPISTATQTALDLKANTTDVTNSLVLKAPLASPTFTGTVSGITKTMVGLGNVDNISDLLKPISTATQSALNLKYDASNPSGYTTNVGTVTSVSSLTLGTTGTDVSSTVATGTTTPAITLNIPTASASNRGALSSADWTTFNSKQSALGYTAANATSISGTTNTIPKFTSSSAIGNSNITDTGSLVTITNSLTLSGSVTGTGNLSNYSVTASAGSATSKKITSTLVASANNDVLVGLDINPTFTNGSFTGVTNNALRVTGTTRFQGTTGSDTAPLGSELAGVTGTGTNWTLAGTNLNVGGYTHTVGSTTAFTTSLAAVSGTYYQITYTITGRTTGSITIAYGGTSTSVSASGNTGPLASSTAVLTITPTTDFNGTVVLSIKSIGTSSASSTFANSAGTSNIEVRSSSITSNTSIGLQAGQRITTGFQNTFIGTQSGVNNTTGNYNTFIGQGAGVSNTTANVNTFVGSLAGNSNTTGAYNSALGAGALQFNTTGGDNVAIGQGAGGQNTIGSQNFYLGSGTIGNTTGSGNVMLGTYAGRWIANGSTVVSVANNSILIGNSTKALADNQTNQIVIGYNATGLGSNTTVLGNSSTVTTAIYGNLVLGSTTDAGYKLDVTGTARVSGVLTLSSTISNGTFAYTLPSATGTLALTSALSGYLPLTGGTLTGALSGTSATFSGILSVFVGGNNTRLANFSTSTYGSARGLRINSYNSSNGGQDCAIEFDSGVATYGGFKFSNSGTPMLTLVDTGAATFSSTLTVNGGISLKNDNNGKLEIGRYSSGAPNSYIKLGSNSDSLRITNNTDVADLFTITNAGSVGIGTSSPNFNNYGTALSLLSVSGYGGIEIYGSGSTNGGQLDFGSGSTRFASISGEYESSTNGYLNIRTIKAGTMTNAVRITSAGNVGIGTSSPASNRKLTVAGSAQFTTGDNSGASFNIVPGATGQDGADFNLSYYTGTGYGPLTFTLGGAERMRIASGGDFLWRKSGSTVSGIGFWMQSANADIYSSIANGTNTYHVYDTTNSAYRFYVTGGGTINASNTTISAISDIRLKENIVDLEIGLDAIMALKPRKFDWKKESGNSGKNVRGFIAQEFEQVFPDLIDKSINPAPQGEEPYKQIRQDLIPVLVKAIQELSAEITILKNK